MTKRIQDNEETLVLKAKCATKKEEIEQLAKSNFALVRRTIAKNLYTPVSILNLLAKDPVANVSKIALNNRKCTVKREDSLKEENRCVDCDMDELDMIKGCSDCKHKLR